MEVHFLNY